MTDSADQGETSHRLPEDFGEAVEMTLISASKTDPEPSPHDSPKPQTKIFSEIARD